MKTDIEIAREAKKLPIQNIAEQLSLTENDIEFYGRYKAKISYDKLCLQKEHTKGKLILVTAIHPTPAGEGKTTTTIGLGDALSSIGKKTCICLREPSLGPCFGMKGGAAGGGLSQVVPMEDINLHFTGDFHAITTANNLLATLIDNHIYWGNKLNFDLRTIEWRRVLDMNDRSLRDIVIALGGTANGFPRQNGFDITAASEIMAILCLSEDRTHLKEKLANITIGYTRDKKPIYARDLQAEGALTVLLKDAILPNIVQTLEHTPALVHGGPFANIAHGCNSVLATKTALKYADYVVTEAGFGADLGAEKFFNIKCRLSGLTPDAVVIVATIRALKFHGGVPVKELNKENIDALQQGLENLQAHLENIQKFGIKPFIAINRFSQDSDAELQLVYKKCQQQGFQSFICNHWAEGSAGCKDLAENVTHFIENNDNNFEVLYNDNLSIWSKICVVTQEIYGANEVIADSVVRKKCQNLSKEQNDMPICIAKTQYSFSTDPQRIGSPKNHTIKVREIKSCTGAGFNVVICGDILRMPGMPKIPASESININTNGEINGLF